MLHHIPVEGGRLCVDALTESSSPVLALHGVSSNRKLWNWVHARAPRLSLVAPDLRGRADSVGVRGPSSLAQHSEDLLRVLDALELDRVTVCGMSMGGFVGVDLATRHPDRIGRLVLVDGGFPMRGHENLRPEHAASVFAPQIEAIERTWDGPGEYVAAHAAANSLISADDPLLHDYLGHFLDAEGRVRISTDALLADVQDVFFTGSPWRRLTVPTWLIHAEWGEGPDSAPAYAPEDTARFHDALPCLAPPRLVPGVDHGGLMWTAGGATQVAALLNEVVE